MNNYLLRCRRQLNNTRGAGGGRSRKSIVTRKMFCVPSIKSGQINELCFRSRSSSLQDSFGFVDVGARRKERCYKNTCFIDVWLQTTHLVRSTQRSCTSALEYDVQKRRKAHCGIHQIHRARYILSNTRLHLIGKCHSYRTQTRGLCRKSTQINCEQPPTGNANREGMTHRQSWRGEAVFHRTQIG